MRTTYTNIPVILIKYMLELMMDVTETRYIDYESNRDISNIKISDGNNRMISIIERLVIDVLS